MIHFWSSLKRARWLSGRRAALIAAVVAAAVAAGTASSSQADSAATRPAVPKVKPSQFALNFAVMKKFRPMTKAGHGLVGVILPDTTTSTRYVAFDAPFLAKAFEKAGYKKSDFVITNAQGSDATMLAMAQSDITKGARVLIVDPLDATVGANVVQYANSHGVPVIAYDRPIFAGKKTYWVSFNNVTVGKEIGTGFMQCVTDWGVKNPKVFTLNGGENSDPNAISFANGYNQVIWGTSKTPLKAGQTNKQGYTLVGDQVATSWSVQTGSTIFAQQFTAHPDINAVVVANDDLANAVIQVLKSKGVGPKTVPTTGQDGTFRGMQNILEGYQCGSAFKPMYLEAQGAVALATMLRANRVPPKSLINGKAVDSTNPKNSQPALLLTPTWVTAKNMQKTVIHDGFISATKLCASVGAKLCTENGINPKGK